VGRRQADLPRGRGTAAGEVGDDPGEGRHAELETAIPARREHPVEARVAELLVRVGRVAGALLVSAWRATKVGAMAAARAISSSGVIVVAVIGR
jgi:hypothetical protein